MNLERILDRARLRSEDYSQSDIDAAATRLAARLAARRAGGTPPQATEERELAPADDTTTQEATRDLRTLCEAVLTRSADDLRRFLADAFPEPTGARVLGCILQLTGGHENAALFWWQYAAGAGDTTATYCLYLHHLSQGESYQADWWHNQTTTPHDTDTLPAPTDPPYQEYSRDITTALRVLRGLKTDRPALPDDLAPVLLYVRSAIYSVLDEELDVPVPEPAFHRHIAELLPTGCPDRTPDRTPGRDALRPRRTSPWPPRTTPGRQTCQPTNINA